MFEVVASRPATLGFVIALIIVVSTGEAQMNRLPGNNEMLAARLAAARGVSPEEAVTMALEEALSKPGEVAPVRSASARAEFIRRLEDISQRAGALPVLDPRPADEILGYDEHGVPT